MTIQRTLIIAMSILFVCSLASAEGFVNQCGPINCVTYAVDISKGTLELFDRDEKGNRFENAEALEKWSVRKGMHLRFATNAGIFDREFTPLGLFIRDGKQIVPLNTSKGDGNFYLQPNGVFYIVHDRGYIVESSQYRPDEQVTLASQSGPLLVIHGELNKNFRKDSENRTIRSGVGMKDNREALFVISDGPVNFYDFASFFRDKLGCGNALYLDGAISKAYIPELNRNQKDGNFGALFAVLESRP